MNLEKSLTTVIIDRANFGATLATPGEVNGPARPTATPAVTYETFSTVTFDRANPKALLATAGEVNGPVRLPVHHQGDPQEPAPQPLTPQEPAHEAGVAQEPAHEAAPQPLAPQDPAHEAGADQEVVIIHLERSYNLRERRPIKYSDKRPYNRKN